VDLDQGVYASLPGVLAGDIDRELIKNRIDVSDPSASLILVDYAETGAIGTREPLAAGYRCRKSDGLHPDRAPLDRVLGYQSRWTPAGQWRW